MNDITDTPGTGDLANSGPPEDASPSAHRDDSVSAAAGPAIVDGTERAVDPRSVVVSRLVALPWIAGIALASLTGVSIAWLAGGLPTGIYVPLLLVGLTVTGLALLAGYEWPALHHRHLRYRVDESGVRIRRGVLWRKVVSIPTSRVQHTDVAQGPLQRHYGIATLTVYTAGTEGASISLSGLEHGVARRLRDHLLPDHEPDGN